MNALGISVHEASVSAALIDAAGVPLALPLGEGADALQRQLLAWPQGGARLGGTAALDTLLRRRGAALGELQTVADADCADRLLQEALAETHAQARAIGGAALRVVVALDDLHIDPDRVWRAAAQAQLPLDACIDQRRALEHYLDWWLAPGILCCRVLDLACDGRLRICRASRRADARFECAETTTTSLPAARALWSNLQDALARQLGVGLDPFPLASAAAGRHLLLECTAAGAGAPFATLRYIGGKEAGFSLAETAVETLLDALADLVECAEETEQLPCVLLCPLLGEELRLRLLDLTLAQQPLLPRNPQAVLAYGAALAAAQPAEMGVVARLGGVLGVHVGDRLHRSRQRFVPLIEAGTPLPAETRRSFYARNSGGTLLFELSVHARGGEQALAQISVALPETSADAAPELQLRLQVTATGDCLYTIGNADGVPVASGCAGRIDARGRAEAAP